MDSRKREINYEYDDSTSKRPRVDVESDSPSSGHDNRREEEFDPNDSSQSPFSLHSEVKSSEEFFPLAKQNERKKRYYRGANEDYIQDNKEKYRQHKKRRSDRERRDRHPRSSTIATDSTHTKDRGSSGDRVSGGNKRSVRYSPYGHGARSKHGLEPQYRGRERDEATHYNRDDEEGYRRDDAGWAIREGRRGSSLERRRPWDENYAQGRGGRSPAKEEQAQPSRRQGRDGWMRERMLEVDSRGRERARDERRFLQKKRMGRRNQIGPLDRSPISGGRSPSGSASSEDSGDDQAVGGVRHKVELRQDIESLIKDLEDVKESSGETSSDTNSSSSQQSRKESSALGMRPEMIGNTRDVRRERSGSNSSGEDYSIGNDDDYSKSHSHPYSRSVSKSPDLEGKNQEWLPGQAMKSKFDSYDLSEGEEVEVEEGQASSSQLLGGMHSDQSDNEKQTAEDEQKRKKQEEEDTENRKLSAQFVKDMEEEEAESDGDSCDLPCYYPALMGCRNVECYEWLNRIEEGAYGVVHRGKDKRTGEIVALKKLKMEKEREGFPITSLREINMLVKAKHPNVVHVKEIEVGSNMDKIFIVMEYVEHDLKTLMDSMSEPFRPGEVKTLMAQLLSAVNHLHDNWILHRDLKASNLLLSHKGILKVGDFGLSREYGSPLKLYTPVVVTLWYRSPELLLGAKEYSTAVDMWSVGCLFAELIKKVPLFKGKSEIDQLNLIFKELGTPSERIWAGYNKLPTVEKVTFTQHPYNVMRKHFPSAVLSDNGFELLNRFLTYDPKKRITASAAMEHQYFKENVPIEAVKSFESIQNKQQYGTKITCTEPPGGGDHPILRNNIF